VVQPAQWEFPVQIVGRHWITGETISVSVVGAQIEKVSSLRSDPAQRDDDVVWLAPAFWDLQTNGRWGISFSDAGLTIDQVRKIILANATLGTVRLCPTLITAERAATDHALRTLTAACDTDRQVGAMVLGFHLEGPYISALDGYRGAHSLGAVRNPDWHEFQHWQELAGGRIRLVTLAPELPGAIAFIERAVAAGVVTAIGHSAADGDTLRAAVTAGARLSTHLGNGIASPLPRHPNAIFAQAADDRLYASLIADGHHLDPATLRVLVRAKRPERIILVSDASPLAGLEVGQYGEWSVDPSGKIVVAGTPYLAGSNQGLEVGISNLGRFVGLSWPEAIRTVTVNPAHLLGESEPVIEAGAPANVVQLRLDASGSATIVSTCVDGVWFEP
jgi:N-acetylglucosamine-6-phosphate deacetylase